jgi:hypothetical protein
MDIHVSSEDKIEERYAIIFNIQYTKEEILPYYNYLLQKKPNSLAFKICKRVLEIKEQNHVYN